MRLRFPIYAKIITWFFLNLLVLGLVLFAFVSWQFRQGFDSLLLGSAGHRIEALGQVVADELREKPADQWDAVLKKFSQAYKVDLFLFQNNGRQLAGDELTLPAEVRNKLNERPRGLRRRLGQQGRDLRGPPARPLDPEIAGGAPPPPFIVRTTGPVYYWVGLRIPSPEGPGMGPRQPPMILLARSDSFFGGGLYFDVRPWIAVGIGVIIFSVLFWMIPVRDLTRSISQMTRATERIALGKFDTRVSTRRGDELGRLSEAINRMAQRLDGFVSGQRRFSGDIAHELCAPLARMEVALGILEQRIGESQKQSLHDLQEEVREMSGLVNELLSFSKASLGRGSSQLTAVNVRRIAEEVIHRESKEPAIIANEVPENLEARADPELLKRALANLLRNAIRYAGDAGPIILSAEPRNESVCLTVSDNGPGVPEADLPKLFDPFYRVDAARTRETGGTGLGLAIVKTCVESCGGTVACWNRAPQGLEVAIHLPAK